MKAKDLIKNIVLYILLWTTIMVLAFYLGEYHGRESVACPEPDTLYIQTSFDEYGEPYQELVTDLEINKYPEAIKK